jgi:four helix bundle protein
MLNRCVGEHVVPSSHEAGIVKSYRDLQVWQAAMDLVVIAYDAAHRLPQGERYELARQLARSAVSVPANIAEGHGRRHLGDYLRHLSIANGSLMEMETHVMIASRLGYLSGQEVRRILMATAEVGRMLHGLIRSLKARTH